MNALERKTQRLVKRYFEKWRTRLGLRWWKIDVFYYTDPDLIKRDFKKEEEDATTLFRVWAQWEYLTARIAVNLVDLGSYSEGEIEKFVVHELVHILVCEMREAGIKHEERVVSTVTSAFFWVKAAVEREGARNGGARNGGARNGGARNGGARNGGAGMEGKT